MSETVSFSSTTNSFREVPLNHRCPPSRGCSMSDILNAGCPSRLLNQQSTDCTSGLKRHGQTNDPKHHQTCLVPELVLPPVRGRLLPARRCRVGCDIHLRWV